LLVDLPIYLCYKFSYKTAQVGGFFVILSKKFERR
jgi:hypothetical protein